MQSLIAKLSQDYPQFQFELAADPHWNQAKQTIFYNPNDPASTLHELGHALCGHDKYKLDTELIIIEREAWNKALELSERYNIPIDPDEIEDALDTYRDWLHTRSRCPSCGQTGWQDATTLLYQCPNCDSSWQANDAKKTALRRRLV